jgi:small-conductance mechanosensitive channel
MAEALNWTLIIQIAQSILVIIASFLAIYLLNRFIVITEERVNVRKGQLIYLRRFFQVFVYSVALILILWIFDIDITGLVAGLGIGAIIIGFGLKEIIENWISGLIIISGRTYGIGDMIMVDGLKGVVTDISLRTTKLRTYDRNEIIIPNSSMLKQNIINITGGENEIVASLKVYFDYTFNTDRVKQVIEKVLKSHPDVIVDEERRREIRYIINIKDWNVEAEILFWINRPEEEEFIKSNILEHIKNAFEEEKILPPIPSILRKDFIGMENNNTQEEE